MIYTDNILDELRDAIFGNNSNVDVDYEGRVVNYNEVGDTYYIINTYPNDSIKSIMVCGKVKSIYENEPDASGYIEVHLKENDFYSVVDYIISHLENIDALIDMQISK